MKIFISYRREDSAGHAGRLYDSLQAYFGQESLFMDLVAIESGQNFVEAIEGAVGSSDVLIAVIGTQWLTCAGRDGRRLDDPLDFVRAELAAALARRTPVIPVLVDGAGMPPAEALPEPLKPLATHHAHEVSDQRWSYDVRRLIQAIEKRAGKPSRMGRRIRLSLAAGVALIAILGAVLVVRSLQSPDEGPQDADAYYSRGTEYLASGDYDRAIADLDRAITLGGRAESYYNRGLAYYSKNDVDSAIANWNDAINLDPREARVYRQRGNAHSVKGAYDLAVADYNRAIELEPRDVRTYYNRGLLFRARDETAKAIADFEAVLTLAGDRDAELDARAQLAELQETATAAPTVHLAGEWSAEVTYFRNSTHTENFRFKLDGNEVLGTASFLGTRRGILEGTLSGNRVLFKTRTQVCTGDCSDPKDLEHRYRGRIAGDVITFDYSQIEDGVPGVPIEFAAKRVSESATATPD
jgi:tetratricopeptide (TPR) repeat protein